MEIKRCARCGGFFETVNEVCNGCVAKDNKDMGKLKNYLEGYSYGEKALTREELSFGTGITMKNLNRYLSAEEFSGVYIADSANLNIAETVEEKIKGKTIKA